MAETAREKMLEDFQRNLSLVTQQRIAVATGEARRERMEHVRKLQIAQASAPKLIVKVRA